MSRSQNSIIRGQGVHILILLFAVMMIATSSIFIRLAADMPPMVIAFYRLLFATILLWGYALIFKRDTIKVSLRHLYLISFAGLFLALHFAFWITSLSYTSVASSVAFVTTSPLFVAFFSWLFKIDRLTIPVIFGLLITVAGSIILALVDMSTTIAYASNPLLGNSLALLGAAAIAGYYMVANLVRKDLGALHCMLYVSLSATVVLAVIVLIQGVPFTGYKINSYFFVVMMTIFCQLFAHTVLNWSLKYVNTTIVAMATLTEPIFASIFAIFILSETVPLLKVVGMLVIVTGLSLTILIKKAK